MLRGTLAVALLLPSVAAAQFYSGNPADGARHYIAPERAYALSVPGTWRIEVNEKDQSAAELRPANGADAFMLVRRLRVPAGASPRQLVLNALEQRLRKLPAFKEGPRRDVTISGSPASLVSGVFYHQGNAQFPRIVEEVFVVRGEEAFAFHFECFQPLSSELSPFLEFIYRTFTIRPSGRGGEGELPRNPNELDVLPDPSRVRF